MTKRKYSDFEILLLRFLNRHLFSASLGSYPFSSWKFNLFIHEFCIFKGKYCANMRNSYKTGLYKIWFINF